MSVPGHSVDYVNEEHYVDGILGTMASQITNLTTVYSTVYSGTDQRKHQSSVSLAFVRGIHRGPVNSSHKWPVTRKMVPFDDVTMLFCENDVETGYSTANHDIIMEPENCPNNHKAGIRIILDLLKDTCAPFTNMG